MNVNEEYEVFYRRKELGISKIKLQKTVDKVGNSAKAVRKELGLRKFT
jgi:Protein of unknown function (DUF3606)